MPIPPPGAFSERFYRGGGGVVIAFSRLWINRAWLWSDEQGKCFFFCPRPRLRIWSHETASAVMSRVSRLILHTQDKSGAYSRAPPLPPAFRGGVNLYRQQPPPSQSRVSWVTQWHTNGIHHLESAGPGPVVLKVVPVTGAAFSGATMDQFCAPLFPHT